MTIHLETFKESKHFRITNVAQGIYAAIAVPGTGSVGNAAILDLGDTTLVVDTFNTLQAAEDLKKAANNLTGKPVSYVVNTHWHSDHTSGNQVFTPEAQIISTSGTQEIMATFGQSRLAQQRANPESIYQAIKEVEGIIQLETDEKLKQELEWENASDRSYVEILPRLIYTLPTLTFDHHLMIHGRDRTVQLITYGGGHTKSDAFVYLPEEKLAIMGDLVLSKHHPVMMHANLKDWLAILEQVEQLEIETIIPGHGEVCSMEALYDVRSYIKDIMALVGESIKNGTHLDDLQVPKAYQPWYFTPYFKGNLKKVSDFLTQSETN